MRRLVVFMLVVLVVLAFALPALASIHPLVCSVVNAQGGGSPTGDIANPPGLTPNGVFFGIPHEDPLEAADGVADFKPIFAVTKGLTDFTSPALKGPGSCGT